MSQTYVLRAGDPDRNMVRANLDSFLDRLPDTKNWQVTVQQYRKPRTLDQNATLWWAYGFCTDAAGLTKDELHMLFCGQYFGTKQVGPLCLPVRSTTVNERGERDPISTVQMGELFEMVQRLAAEWWTVDVPDPDPMRGRWAA